jgi:hypothetical protein
MVKNIYVLASYAFALKAKPTFIYVRRIVKKEKANALYNINERVIE